MARCLNRHSNMVCGPESSLFARPQLFSDWSKFKSRIARKTVFKLKNHGWHRYYGVQLDPEFYQIQPKELKTLIQQAKSYSNFLTVLDSHIATHYEVEQWVEKTPSNANSFDSILRELPYARLILTVRNPYDAIASLMNRGYSTVYATAWYLMNISTGYVDDSRVMTVTYEDMVTDPTDTLIRVCNHIELEFEDSMLQPENQNITMDGWRYDETGEIGQDSIGRFRDLDNTQKSNVIHAVHSLGISPLYKSIGSKPRFSRIEDICKTFNYEYIPPSTKKGRFWIRKELAAESFTRTWKRYPTSIGNFPIIISR